MQRLSIGGQAIKGKAAPGAPATPVATRAPLSAAGLTLMAAQSSQPNITSRSNSLLSPSQRRESKDANRMNSPINRMRSSSPSSPTHAVPPKARSLGGQLAKGRPHELSLTLQASAHPAMSMNTPVSSTNPGLHSTSSLHLVASSLAPDHTKTPRSSAQAPSKSTLARAAEVITRGDKINEDGQEGPNISKIHSAVRWGKPRADIDALLAEMGATKEFALVTQDSMNGNYSLHIAAQNGHIDLVRFLIESGANVNAQNFKGQAALHMSVEYDFYFLSKVLIEAGADPKLQNNAGHEALTGIEGEKTGNNTWDNPVTIFKAANNKEQIDLAFSTLEQADTASLDKAVLVQAGMAKKKSCPEHWDADRFQALLHRL